MDILAQGLIDQHGHDLRQHQLSQHIPAVVQEGIDPGVGHGHVHEGLRHPHAPDPGAGYQVAHEAQEEGHGDAHRHRFAGLAEGLFKDARQADHRVSDHIVQQDDAHRRQEGRSVAHVVQAEDQLDQAVGEGRQEAPFPAPAVADEYQRLETRALRLFLEIPEETKDAYKQLVLFPVQAGANIYDMYYAQAMNQYCAERNDPDANRWAQRVKECFDRDAALNASYNKDIAGGKWNGMMTQKHIGYTSWNDNFRADMLPRTREVEAATGGYIFSPSNGFVAMEAEHFFSATAAEGTEWTVYPYYGRTRSAVALTPYTKPTGDAKLTYKFTLPANHPSEVKVLVVVKSTLDFENRGGHEYTVSLDSSEPAVVNFNKNLVDKQPYQYSVFYPTIARRVVENTVTFPVGSSETHELVIHPRHSGIVFEKIVVDFGGYRPSYLFGTESETKR